MFWQHSVVMMAIGGLFLATSGIHAEGMFDSQFKDFGTVARGTVVTHQFRMTNTTANPVHVSGLRTSCVCSTASLAKQELQPNESTTLQVTVDTHKFGGLRVFTIYVLIDRPFVEEIRLTVQVQSREDVTLNPGQLAFGRVKKGSAAKSSVLVEYHGLAPWQITGVENENGYLLPNLQRVEQTSAQAAYLLEVSLRDDTPVGAWHADLWLKTTDSSSPRIRVPLTVEVEPSLIATPAAVTLGQVRAGAQTERRVVIRGSVPFKVAKVEGADDLIQVTGGSDEPKVVQVLKVSLKAGEQAEELSRQIRIITDLPTEDQVGFMVQAVIVK